MCVCARALSHVWLLSPRTPFVEFTQGGRVRLWLVRSAGVEHPVVGPGRYACRWTLAWCLVWGCHELCLWGHRCAWVFGEGIHNGSLNNVILFYHP